MRISMLATVCAVGLALAGNVLAEPALEVLGQNYSLAVSGTKYNT